MDRWYIVNNEETKFRIKELFDKEIELISIVICETLYGSIADVELNANIKELDEDFKLNKEYNCSLIDQYGNVTEFKCFCAFLSFVDNFLQMKFLCCDKDFTKKSLVNKFKNIDDAIKSASKMQRLDNPLIKTDLLEFNDPYYIYQTNEANNRFCTRLCWSYKHYTTFGYLLNGLKFIDLKSWKPDLELIERRDIRLLEPASWNRNKKLDEDIKYIDYSNGRDPNHILIKFFDQTIVADTPYKFLIGNKLFNEKLVQFSQKNKFEVKFYPGWTVGTFVNLKPSPQINFIECIITSRRIKFEKASVSTLYGIQSIVLPNI